MGSRSTFWVGFKPIRKIFSLIFKKRAHSRCLLDRKSFFRTIEIQYKEIPFRRERKDKDIDSDQTRTFDPLMVLRVKIKFCKLIYSLLKPRPPCEQGEASRSVPFCVGLRQKNKDIGFIELNESLDFQSTQ